jgi:alkylhydroperoxidase family enzyme
MALSDAHMGEQTLSPAAYLKPIPLEDTMSDYILHTKETAPDAAKPLFDEYVTKFGFVPNLIAKMSTSPALAEAYLQMSGLGAKTGLTPVERQVVYQSLNFEANCTYCVAAHSRISEFDGVPAEITDALRKGEALPDAKLNALSKFAKEARAVHGHVSKAQQEALFAAGYDKSHVLDIIVLLATKVLSNATNYIAETPVDEAFSAHAWQKPVAAAAE